MEFRTEIKPITGEEGLISHSSPVMLTGSCFTDNIGGCMRDELFDVCVNPFGPIYNPASILMAIETVANRRHIEDSELFEHEGRWHSFLFHSRYSASSAGEAQLKMNMSIERAYHTLRDAGTLILTLGTTRIFTRGDDRRVVANCHKLPGREFEERPLSLQECTDLLGRTVEIARQFNPGLKIIFTVSPLRYLNHGAHANAIAKSTLLMAVDNVMATMPDIYYFHAYEIMMDDLRDYRFYADDMKHPSAQAVRYIYENFSSSYYTPSTRLIAAEARKLTRRLAHRPFGPTDMSLSADQTVNDFKKSHPALAPIIDRYISDGIQ